MPPPCKQNKNVRSREGDRPARSMMRRPGHRSKSPNRDIHAVLLLKKKIVDNTPSENTNNKHTHTQKEKGKKKKKKCGRSSLHQTIKIHIFSVVTPVVLVLLINPDQPFFSEPPPADNLVDIHTHTRTHEYLRVYNNEEGRGYKSSSIDRTCREHKPPTPQK